MNNAVSAGVRLFFLGTNCALAHGYVASQLLYDWLEDRECQALLNNTTYARGYLLALIKVRCWFVLRATKCVSFKRLLSSGVRRGA